jgi:hypothetical protein
MKKLFKIGLLVATALMLITPPKAEAVYIISTNLPANRTINFGSNGFRIYSIEVNNTNEATIARLYFFNSPVTNTFWTNNAYTNITRTVGTITNIYTNVLGTITTNTYPGILVASNVVAAGTFTYPLFKSFVVNSNTVSTWEPPNPVQVGGITSTNSAAVNLTIIYD